MATMKKPPRKLVDQVREALQLKHYSICTEEAYVAWIKRYIFFHHKRHPNEMGTAEIEAFLTHLAVAQKVAASTQNQALSALLFLYREVLRSPLDASIDAVRAKKPKRLRTVLTKDEALRVIGGLSGLQQLMARLLFGSGLRLLECVRLRVKDVDFAQRQIIVCDGKGMEDRVTMLPGSLITPLQGHLTRVKRCHERDLAAGYGSVYLRPHSNESSQMPSEPGFGNMSFPRIGCRKTHVLRSCAAIMSARAVCKKPSALQPAWWVCLSASVVTPFAIASRRISCNRATISEPFKNSWDTKM